MDRSPVLMVPSVDYHEAEGGIRYGDVMELKLGVSIVELMKDVFKDFKVRGKLGIESSLISNELTERLRAMEGVEGLINVHDVISRLRSVKDQDELKALEASVNIAERGLKRALEIIDVGVKEFEVAAEVEYIMRRAGSQGIAFDTIVSSGRRSTYPHATPTDKPIERGDLVIVDLGARFKGYRSDLTRTFMISPLDGRKRDVYEVALNAQEEALKHIKAGVKASEVDRRVRASLKSKGVGEFFIHGLGHGIGLSVHEAPTLSPTSPDMIEDGCVLTVEPGIYIDDVGGVRIEDMVYVTVDRVKLLSSFERSLTII